jgi:phosphoribosylamine-glycine ligase
MARRFIVVTADHSGLGWALKLNAEGEDVILAVEPDADEEDLDGNALVGSGLVTRMTPDEALAQSDQGSTYVIFDANKLAPLSERLRSDGWKVFGATAWSARLEHDRQFAVDTAKLAGLGIPLDRECTSRHDGLAFLDEYPDRAFVFKPNTADERYRTTVPTLRNPFDANRQIAAHLEAVDEAALADCFLLQERKDGIEVNFELWLDRGMPILAVCGLETKQKLNGDLGTQVGCSSDLAFIVPVDCRGVRQAVSAWASLYGSRYTGFADVNVMLADRQAWFLETCSRFGYSFHPNLFLTCAIDTFGNILADWMDGKTAQFGERFRAGFGASVNLYTDVPQRGVWLRVLPDVDPSTYLYDAYEQGGRLLSAGYSRDVAVFAQHGYTIDDAVRGCLDQLLVKQAVTFIGAGFRTDAADRSYLNSPIKRYEALQAMRVFEPVRSSVGA